MKDSTVMYILSLLVLSASIITSGDFSNTLMTVFSVIFVGSVIIKNIEDK